jgi:hypothetical protein
MNAYDKLAPEDKMLARDAVQELLDGLRRAGMPLEHLPELTKRLNAFAPGLLDPQDTSRDE